MRLRAIIHILLGKPYFFTGVRHIKGDMMDVIYSHKLPEAKINRDAFLNITSGHALGHMLHSALHTADTDIEELLSKVEGKV